jgi:hypothetical protein
MGAPLHSYPYEDDKISVRSFRSERVLNRNLTNNGKDSPRLISTPINQSILSRENEDFTMLNNNYQLNISHEKNDSL